ncbi:MAG: AsnC family transcriptional regulator [Ponticaulis sp.]|nr:AsnC family transcriptional regulator [Ponticaulis sp.]
MKLSEQDHAMIELLKRSARMSVSDMAKALGVSRSTAQKRLERLETAGVIESYSCILAAPYQRDWVSAHILVRVAAKQMDAVVDRLNHVKGIEEVHSVSGEFDLIVVVSAPSVTTLEVSIDEVIAIEGVERTTTSVILSTRISRKAG